MPGEGYELLCVPRRQQLSGLSTGDRSEPKMLKIAVKGWPLIARNNGTNVAIRPDQHPSAWCKTVAGPNMSTVVNDISARTERVDVQMGACWYRCLAIYLIPQQSPMW